MFMGDLHLGYRFTDEHALGRDIDRIKDERMHWIGMGDYCEQIAMRDSKRFDPRMLALWIDRDEVDIAPEIQVERLQRLLKPISSQCIGFLAGNHEMTIRKHFSHVPYGRVAKWLELSEEICIGKTGFITVQFWHRGSIVWEFDIFAQHGYYGCGQYIGTAALAMEKQMMKAEGALVFAQGHTHKRFAIPTRVQKSNRENFDPMLIDCTQPNTYPERGILLMNCGSYMRGELGGYSEELKPLGIGAVALQVIPGKRIISPEQVMYCE